MEMEGSSPTARGTASARSAYSSWTTTTTPRKRSPPTCGSRATRGERAATARRAAHRRVLRPDVAFIDLNMPRMDGAEVARRLRVTPWGRRATARRADRHGPAGDIARTREAGFDEHLTKPAELEAGLAHRRRRGAATRGLASFLVRVISSRDWLERRGRAVRPARAASSVFSSRGCCVAVLWARRFPWRCCSMGCGHYPPSMRVSALCRA